MACFVLFCPVVHFECFLQYVFLGIHRFHACVSGFSNNFMSFAYTRFFTGSKRNARFPGEQRERTRGQASPEVCEPQIWRAKTEISRVLRLA